MQGHPAEASQRALPPVAFVRVGTFCGLIPVLEDVIPIGNWCLCQEFSPPYASTEVASGREGAQPGIALTWTPTLWGLFPPNCSLDPTQLPGRFTALR